MNELITAIVVCGVGADLCTLPLLVVAGLLLTGMQQAPDSLEWMASQWILGGAILVVISEFALDETIGKQEGARELWKRMQHVLTACVVVVVTLSMSRGLSNDQIFQAMVAGFTVTNVIKVGLIDRIKSVWGVVGGGV